jgi:chorismate lyase
VSLPTWRSADRSAHLPDSPLADWLTDEGSLTLRLTEAGAGDFRVELLGQGIQPARTDEAAVLGMTEGEPLWAREVLLHTAGAARVFARSVAPLTILQAANLNLADLGTRSLGELLFNDAQMPRGPIEVSRYPADWIPQRVRSQGCWARRSRFGTAPLQLLVCEVFLNGWPPAS